VAALRRLRKKKKKKRERERGGRGEREREKERERERQKREKKLSNTQCFDHSANRGLLSSGTEISLEGRIKETPEGESTAGP